MSLLQTFMMVLCSCDCVEQRALIVGIGNFAWNIDDEVINFRHSDSFETLRGYKHLECHTKKDTIKCIYSSLHVEKSSKEDFARFCV